MRHSESCTTSIRKERYSVLTCNPYQKASYNYTMETFDRQLFRIVAKIFAVAKSTAVQITREVCLEILRLVTRYNHFLKSRRETAEAVE